MTDKVAGQSSGLIYSLEDKPPLAHSVYASIQHILASFVGLITPALIIGATLGLHEQIPYLISMALMVSGVGTFIQARRVGPIGAGMLCVQGTSFAFLGSVIAAGFIAKSNGGGPDEILSLIFGVCFFGAFFEIFLSFYIEKLQQVITPLVSGIVITIIGVSLIQVGVTDLAGGHGAETFGDPKNLLVGATAVVVIIAMNCSSNLLVRLSAIFVGIGVGWLLSLALGTAEMGSFDGVALVSIPIPFKYGFSFDWMAFVPVCIVYVITTLETAGDITANCQISQQPIKGKAYFKRLRSGILGDGVVSVIASTFNAFPHTTISQNNGVIQITGIASRHVGMVLGVMLMLLGLFPAIGAFLQMIPKPALGGATIVLFGTVAAAGVKILASEHLCRRKLLIMAVSFGFGIGVTLVPNVFAQLPELARNILSSPVTAGGFAAIILTLVLPEEKHSDEECAASVASPDAVLAADS
ncbi:uracil-xanthine permease family protein [Sinobacterium caligoides]|nr:uracil-xanthine permease family protein [Sinobacterium caligoides]